MGSNRYKAQQFIDAIKGSGGIVTVIADRVGCDWNTAKRWIDEYPTVGQAYANETEKVLDRAESVLIGNINSGDSADAKWYLTKKGKHRGYGDRLEITGKDGDPFSVQWVDYRDQIAGAEE